MTAKLIDSVGNSGVKFCRSLDLKVHAFPIVEDMPFLYRQICNLIHIKMDFGKLAERNSFFLT